MDIDAAVDRSVEVSDLLDSLAKVGDHFISWADRRQKLLAGYRRDLRRLRAVADELSDEWHELAEVQVAGMELMRRPAMVRKYLAQHREDLTREQRALFREFMRRPWFWTLFSVADQVRGDVYRVVDHLSDCERLFYSPALTDLYRQGERLFFTAAYSNGLCCQTFGVVHCHRGFQPYDFPYLAKALRPNILRAQGLEAAVAARPAYFVLLARWAEIPAAVFSEQPIRWDAHEVTVRSFSVERYAADFEISVVPERRQVFEGRLRDRDTPFELATFYYDAVEGVLTAVTAGPAARSAFAARTQRVEALLAESRAAGLDVEAATGGGAEDLSLELLPRLLEDLFFAHWQAENATVLTYTLCLLHHGGAAPQRVSDYAAEVLRIFWQVLLPDKAAAYIRGFIEKYALFCWEVLEPLGVVEIEGAVDRAQASEARFRVTGGPLLHSFFRLSRYWE